MKSGSRLVPAGALLGESTWAPSSLKSSPEREWRKRTMAWMAKKKVRTRRRSICASSHCSKGPKNISSRLATFWACSGPLSWCIIKKTPPGAWWFT